MNDEYKLAVIKNPFFNKEYDKGKFIFSQAISLRMEGYAYVHGENIIPIDQYDFFSTNLLIYKEKGKEDIIPFACCKIISYRDCLKNNLPFPPLEYLKEDKNTDSLLEVTKLVTEAENDISFVCSFTIAPALQGTQESLSVIKYTIGSVLNWHKDEKINFITSATLKVKTDKLFKKLGFLEVSDNSLYHLKSINNEEAIIMKYIHTPSKQGKKWLNDSFNLWEERIEYNSKKESVYA
jgi:hypothetical protein